jgi:formate hydrogenlyase subunit 4
MDDRAAGVVVAGIQVALTFAIAPLLLGITKRVKARLQYRRGPSLLQPYRDLAKWWAKESVESDVATGLTAVAPAIVLSATIVATLLVPRLLLVGAAAALLGIVSWLVQL